MIGSDGESDGKRDIKQGSHMGGAKSLSGTGLCASTGAGRCGGFTADIKYIINKRGTGRSSSVDGSLQDDVKVSLRLDGVDVLDDVRVV